MQARLKVLLILLSVVCLSFSFDKFRGHIVKPDLCLGSTGQCWQEKNEKLTETEIGWYLADDV